MDRVTPNTFVAMFNRDSVMMGETPSGNGVCSARGLERARDAGMGGTVTEFSQVRN